MEAEETGVRRADGDGVTDLEHGGGVGDNGRRSAAEIGQPVVLIGLLWLMTFIVFTGIALNRIRVSRKSPS